MSILVHHAISISIKVTLFSMLIVGPVYAMTYHKANGYGDEPTAAGLVLINSLQRG